MMRHGKMSGKGRGDITPSFPSRPGEPSRPCTVTPPQFPPTTFCAGIPFCKKAIGKRSCQPKKQILNMVRITPRTEGRGGKILHLSGHPWASMAAVAARQARNAGGACDLCGAWSNRQRGGSENESELGRGCERQANFSRIKYVPPSLLLSLPFFPNPPSRSPSLFPPPCLPLSSPLPSSLLSTAFLWFCSHPSARRDPAGL